MRRRTFLRNTVMGIGTLAGMHGLKAEAASRNQQPVVAAQSGASGLAETKEAGQLVWGTNAVVLKSPWSSLPSLDDLLADREQTLVLNQFYRFGGDNRAVTPTECRIGYDRTHSWWFFVARKTTCLSLSGCKGRIGMHCAVCPLDQIPGPLFPTKWTF